MDPNIQALNSDCDDMLLDLPSETLDIIFSKLSIKNAVRTSILSRRWRHRWCSVPDLYLVFDSVESLRWGNIVSNILLQHHQYPGDINKFTLIIPLPGRSEKVFQNFHVWINILSNRRVRELAILFYRCVGVTCLADRYLLPSYLFSCHHLTKLRLENCVLKPPLNSVGLKHLQFLQLASVSVPAAALFEQFMSVCPSLEVLKLENIEGPTCLNICAPNLKKLDVLNHTYGTTLKMVKIDRCLLLEELFLDLQYFVTDIMRDISRLAFLRRVTFKGSNTPRVYDLGNPPEVPEASCFSGSHRLAELEVVCKSTKHKVMVADILQFASVFPNLRCLRLNIFEYLGPKYDHHLPIEHCFKGDAVHYASLCKVFIQNFRDKQPEMEVVRLLLESCPSLVLMDLKLSNYIRTAEEMEVMLKKLKAMPRSSLNVNFKIHSYKQR